GGETLPAGHTYTIRWTQKDIDMVTLGYSTTTGQVDWIVYNRAVDPQDTTGSYDWVVPANLAGKTTVKVEILGYKTGTGAEYDWSNDVFSVVTP
ncbi:hypothetical protein COY95_03680, partial [Candidatus Woesearchaeota archaeon CG_4_10_14_0_8_um_filter_47_5]